MESRHDAAAFLDQPVSMGTTIMAATFDGGVILGADSRTSTGDYIANRVTDKITPLSDSVYICRSGSAADTQNMSRYISWFLEQHEMDLGEGPRVETAAKLAQSMAYQNKNHLQAGLIVAGWDRVAGGSVFAIPLGGTIVNTPFSIGGSGSAYITGLCDRLWKANMTEEECKAFVIKAVSHAMARDGSSGGCIRTVIITKDGVKRDFLPHNRIPITHGELPHPEPQSVAAA
ncbi:PBA1 [Auxenochlorella protothecoides x Auxenochlorella symbiontica]|uniref:proteasome endopeptidase complex n=1 Tax=Auxenochlorella protothecoides TaxID=3075 RepID=A0A1D2A0Y3_AUXPR